MRKLDCVSHYLSIDYPPIITLINSQNDFVKKLIKIWQQIHDIKKKTYL